MASFIAAGTVVRHPRRADDAVLHVLFDVRIPAGRRPHLAGGRHAGPRLPDGGHRRTHDAARRGAPAPGRPQPRAGVDGAGGAGLRPGVRLRGEHDRAGRHQPHVRRRPARGDRRLLLHHPLQRELRDAARCPTPLGWPSRSWRACTSSPMRRRGRRSGRRSCSPASAHTAAREAAAELAEHYDVGAELWSATSYKTLREEAMSAERFNRLHPSQERRVPLVAQRLAAAEGPIVAVSDFMTLVPEQIIRFLPGRTFVPLGTDGMGRSDTREALRRHFEVDTGHVVVGVLDRSARRRRRRSVRGRGRDQALRHRRRRARPVPELTELTCNAGSGTCVAGSTTARHAQVRIRFTRRRFRCHSASCWCSSAGSWARHEGLRELLQARHGVRGSAWTSA